MILCICRGVTDDEILEAIRRGAFTLEKIAPLRRRRDHRLRLLSLRAPGPPRGPAASSKSPSATAARESGPLPAPVVTGGMKGSKKVVEV